MNINSNNFLNDILNYRDSCSSVYCPDNYISEISGTRECTSSPCNLEGEDLNICCNKLCNTDLDCDENTSCTDYKDMKVCLNKCNVDSDCNYYLVCKDTGENKICSNPDVNTNFISKIYYKIERILNINNIIVDSILLILIAYLISKLINIFNININI